MTKDVLRYDRMMERAMRGVVREALTYTARHGLPGGHHFYITFRTDQQGVGLAESLREKYPEEMTIVLEHQFWELRIADEGFSVTLNFKNRPERLTVPFAAITRFYDPSVKFGLQFQENAAGEAAPPPPPVEPKRPAAAEHPAPAKEKRLPHLVSDAADKEGKKDRAKKPAEVVTLDTFRKK